MEIPRYRRARLRFSMHIVRIPPKAISARPIVPPGVSSSSTASLGVPRHIEYAASGVASLGDGLLSAVGSRLASRTKAASGDDCRGVVLDDQGASGAENLSNWNVQVGELLAAVIKSQFSLEVLSGLYIGPQLSQCHVILLLHRNVSIGVVGCWVIIIIIELE